jgi:hypothetical protein
MVVAEQVTLPRATSCLYTEIGVFFRNNCCSLGTARVGDNIPSRPLDSKDLACAR